MMFESAYENPLVSRIAESASILESYTANMHSESPLDSASIISRATIILALPDDQVDDLLEIKGLAVEGSPDGKAALLFKDILNDTQKLISEYREENSKSGKDSTPKYEEPIDKIDVVNSAKQSIKVADQLAGLIKDPNLLEIFKIIAPDDFVCRSTDEYGRLQEFINSYQTDIPTQVNQEIPEYIFKLMGEYWEIRFGDDIIRLKDSKGLKYINSLLKNPYQPIRSDSLTAPHVNVTSSTREDTSNQVKEKEAPRVRYAPDTVYVNMTNKIKELEELLLQLIPGSNEYFLAEKHIKMERKKRSRDFNRAGQERPHDSGEKARQAVFTAITTAKKRVNKSLPDLFAHLQRYLNTGFECIYDPPPSELKSWHL